MKKLASTLTCLLLTVLACLVVTAPPSRDAVAQTKVLPLRMLPLADLVLHLHGQMGHNPSVDNAALISAALANRDYSGVNIPPGICEIWDTIVGPARSGTTLWGAGANADLGDAHFSGNGQGGTCSRIVAKFDTPGKAMYRVQGKQGRIEGISFEAYPLPGVWWNFVTNATNATPIVCTTSSAHGLSDNDQVEIYGISGNTNANGTFYVDVLTDSTFALYSESGPTTAVAGNGDDSTGNDATAVWQPVNRAQVGIHVVTEENSGFGTGKVTVRNCSFNGLPVGVLFGKNMTSAWDTEDDYDGENAANADESVLDFCTWNYPYTGGFSDNRTAIYLRTIQAVGFSFRHCTLNGWATEFIYAERGGMFDARLYVNGNCSHVLRVGVPLYPVDIDVWMNIDGSGDLEGTGAVLGRYTKPLLIDKHSAGGHIKISGNQRAAVGDNTIAVAKPQFLVRGTCKLDIEDFNGLVPNGIQLIGQSFSSTRRPAICNFDNCTLYYSNNPDDMVTETTGTNASAVPCLQTWKNSQAAFASDDGLTIELQPITDGSDSNLGDTPMAP